MRDGLPRVGKARSGWLLRLLRQRWVWGGLAAAALAVAMGVTHRAHARVTSVDQIQDDTALGCLRLLRVPLSGAMGELSRFRRDLHSNLRHVPTVPSGDTAGETLRQVRAALTDLDARSLEWEKRMGQTTLGARSDCWHDIQGEVMRERVRWPLVVGRQTVLDSRLVDLLDPFRDGLADGAVWPVRVVRRALVRPQREMGRFQYAVFPYDVSSPPGLPFMLGLGVAALLVGYGFCWVGTKMRRYWLGDVGLIYFLYAIIFAVLVVNLRAGMW